MDHGPSIAPRSARIIRHEDNRVEIETSSDAPAMLVMSEKWDPDWRAWLDGMPVKIFKANFLMRAIEAPPGKHVVLMEYRPSMRPFWFSTVSVAILGLCGTAWVLRRHPWR